jgi:Flp pilus assembly CpaF family ATPase
LQSIQHRFLELTEFNFLKQILEIQANEFFFHSTECLQALFPNGQKQILNTPIDREDWQMWLEILSIKFHQNWNLENPFVSFYANLFDKDCRLSMIHLSTSPQKKSKFTIRILASSPYELETFGLSNTLRDLVNEKRNVLIAGSTGSGKTSLLSSMLTQINPSEHIIILEDTYEIQSLHPYQTRFLSGTSSQTSLESYLKNSLRLSPDRLILGEMRSHEVIPFFLSMNTGHKRLMGTIHSSSAVDAINRVALLFSLFGGNTGMDYNHVVNLICRNLDFVVFVENKKVTEIIKVLGSERVIPFYECLF